MKTHRYCLNCGRPGVSTCGACKAERRRLRELHRDDGACDTRYAAHKAANVRRLALRAALGLPLFPARRTTA